MNYQYEWTSPLGVLQLLSSNDHLTGLYFENHQPAPRITAGIRDAKAFTHVVAQLEEYFAGQRSQFDIPIAFQGTAFQQAVWSQLQQIPYGQTTSYKDIASSLQRENAVRAVGGAVARNPVSIVVPCHRVVGASGALTGFAGGVARKSALLNLERAPFVLHREAV